MTKSPAVQSKPIAVLISDVHYTLSTLEVADTAWRAAVDKAAELKVPLIDAGDITNDKAILRAEVVNRLLETQRYATSSWVECLYLVGNHSLINEKGSEHSLHFLGSEVVSEVTQMGSYGIWLIPYQASSDAFYAALNTIPKGSIVIAHQGTLGGYLGDYVKDSSAFDPTLTRDWRIFLGHYHRHYELENTVSIGNPYTLTFGEAHDGPKGFLVLYEDGSYTREILPLRKHIIYDIGPGEQITAHGYNPGDLVWFKVRDDRSILDRTKMQIRAKISSLISNSNFKLDLIPTTAAEECPQENNRTEKLTDTETLDKLIDGTAESDDQKVYLKSLWRDLINAPKNLQRK